MLTIKQITSSGETLYQGDEVMFLDGEAAAAKQVMYLVGGKWQSLTSGIIYVMNDNGKTVANYDLIPVNMSSLNVAYASGAQGMATA